MPIPLTPLVGRERELAQAQALIRRPEVRLVTLTGPGGIGKTRLAIRLAADLAGEFTDGVHFIPLASVRDPGLVAVSIAQSVGVPPSGGASMHDALVTALKPANMLLVIDNIEHVLVAASVLTDLLASCPDLNIMVTSRVLLRLDGEHALAVPPLSFPDPQASPTLDDLMHASAIQLFAERAQAVEPSFHLDETSVPQVAEICHRLDGLPLAIELVAPRVRHLPLPDLLNRLDRRLPLLTGGSRDKPSRLQTMHNAIAWSHDLLPPEVQAVFRRLAVFSGGCSLDAAEQVASTLPQEYSEVKQKHAPSVFDGLAALIDASLLQTGTGPDGAARYRMLETIREFGLERLESSGEATSVRSAHAAYFLALAERYELTDLLPEGNRVLEVLEAEHANLRVALGWLWETGDTGRLRRLAAALGRFWADQGYYQEGRVWLERAVTSDTDPTDAARAKALFYLGMMEAFQSGSREAELRLMAGVHSCRQAGATFHAAVAMIVLGWLVNQRGDVDGGTALLEEAIATARTMTDPRLQAIVLGWALANLAEVARMRGDHALAAEGLEAGLQYHRDTGYAGGMILMLKDLGELARDQRRHEHAIAYYREALGLVRANPGTRVVTEVIEALGIATVAAGQPERGVRLLGASEAQRERIGLRFRLPMTEAALEPAVTAARAALGNQAFAATWAAGRELQPGQAVTEALDLAAIPANPPSSISLTPREQEILELLAAGLTDPAIASRLFLSVRTVENHVARILPKFGVRTRTAAVSAAIAAGLVTPGAPPPD